MKLDENGKLTWHGTIDDQPVIETKEPQTSGWRRFQAWFLKIVPDNPRRAYDMTKVVRAIVDQGEVFEIKPRWARNIITALARLDGIPVGIADGPAKESVSGDGALPVLEDEPFNHRCAVVGLVADAHRRQAGAGALSPDHAHSPLKEAAVRVDDPAPLGENRLAEPYNLGHIILMALGEAEVWVLPAGSVPPSPGC